MEIDELLLAVMPVRPEHASQMDGCTHTCRHLQAQLEDGKPTIIYPVRFDLSEGRAMKAALCRECYVRNQVAKN
jgi:hypothetical protein